MRRQAVMAATLILLGVVGSACVFGPPVDCGPVAAEDCRRAIEMAQPLVREHWEQARKVVVRFGPCSLARHCQARFANDPRWITVDLPTDEPAWAFVVINRSGANWTAECALTVRDEHGSHGEPCEEA
jgi:hypothetical protein